MDIKPSELFVGIIDFFAIFMPGAILSYAAKDFANQEIFGKIFPVLQTEAQGWGVFLFSSYLLGHFIFMLGSFLDDLVYDRIRKRLFTKNDDRLYQRAQEIKEKILGDSAYEETVNTFKWAKANILLFQSTAILEIHRLEADSKFFRSLIIVLLLLFPYLFFCQHAWIAYTINLVFIVLSLYRYAEQRYKATETAYTCLLAMHHKQVIDIALKTAEQSKSK